MHKFLLITFAALPLATAAQMKAPHEWKDYETVFSVKEGLRSRDCDVIPFYSSAPANVFWPEDKIELKFQVKNNTGQAIKTNAHVHIVRYGTRGIPGDVWTPQVVPMDYEQILRRPLSIAPKGYADVSVAIDNEDLPYGGYAVVFDLGEHGRQLATSFVRSMTPRPVRMQYPRQSLDDLGADFLSRVGVQAIRHGMGYVPTSAPGYRQMMQDFDRKMKQYHDNNITVLIMIGEGGSLMPLGTPRPHLDNRGFFLRTKQDYVWLPTMDSDFKRFVKEICLRYGWPRGPVTAVSLWNEPWEGMSISGWQSDIPRYREIYGKMAEAVVEAREEGADVLVGGCDSNSNAMDKLFADGTQDMLPVFDFLSIHYQGMESPVLYPEWNSRRFHKGRILIWDTESWVGNSDDRIGLVVATNRSAGYDRSMGIYGGYLYSGEKAAPFVEIQTASGAQSVPAVHAAWSPAAAVGATQRLVGERDFNRLLFQNGLPWVMVFDGYEGNADDGTLVVAGDLGDAFGRDNVLFRSVKGLSDRRPITAGTLFLPAHRDFRVYDFYGNVVPARGKFYEIPLGCQGWFLRTSGRKASFDRLLKAVRTARVEGYEPVEIIARDFTSPVETSPEMELMLTNILNRDITAKMQVKIEGLTVTAFPEEIILKANETQTLRVKASGRSNPENTYPLEVLVDAGLDGTAMHSENIHANVIARRTIAIDGKLDDWQGILPQTVRGSSEAGVSLTEAAWFPFEKFDERSDGLAHAWLAHDDSCFYFAAKVADRTPNAGTLRFETRDDDRFFYPDTALMQTVYAMQTLTSAAYLENSTTTQSIGIDIDLPTNKVTKTSLYFPAIAQHGVSVTVYDRETGRELLSDRTDKLWNGFYLSLYLSGKIRIRCSAYGWWYTAKLSGVFFDPSELTAAGKASAAMAGKDFDTEGQWQGVYGSLGGYVVQDAKIRKMEGNALPAASVPEMRTVDEDNFVVLPWPEDVRRFTYRRRPTTPDGCFGELTDNILIAFNVLPLGTDGMEAHSRGVMPRYTGYKCSDYEYALNTVAPEYGGGFEIWRLLTPGMPRKHFFPRQGKSPFDGAVKNGLLTTVRDGGTRYTECAIPWSEMPDVKAAIDRGETVKFSFRVNDDGAPAACMELARGRSVSKKNSRAFHPDWKEHWANEVAFGVETSGGDNSVRNDSVKGNADAGKLIDCVNPFIGTAGHGHTFPGAATPFGMVQVSPDTGLKGWDWCSGYHYTDSSIIGFSHTHLSGTGRSDLMDVMLMPVTGAVHLDPGTAANPDAGYRSRFSHEEESASPGYYRVKLKDYNILAEMTATSRCGFHRYTFPATDSAAIVLDLAHHYSTDSIRLLSLKVADRHTITGARQTKGWGDPGELYWSNQQIYFAIRFSRPVERFSLHEDGKLMYPEMGKRIAGKDVKAVVHYKTAADETICVKVGISAVSVENALLNLETEIPGWDFDRVLSATQSAWEQELSKIQVKAPARERTVFYTALYHSLLVPYIYSDVNGEYRGFDGRTHVADSSGQYTVLSLWDTFRAEHPLLTLLAPDRVSGIIRSMLAQYDQYGLLPVWPLWSSETNCMIGYHAVPVIVDAYFKGIRDFDVEKAYRAMKTSAMQDGFGIKQLKAHGYIPFDKYNKSVSTALEYCFDDWCIAQLAQALGKTDDYAYFMQRSRTYRTYFDPEYRLMNGFSSERQFRRPFDPFYSSYGQCDWVEGNAWQYSFFAPHDVPGLIGLWGSDEAFAAALDTLFSVRSGLSGNDVPIDITGLIGQYAHGNEPSHHVAYLYQYVNRPQATQERVHQIMTEFYSDRPDGLCGNEDCGQMSAWYVFSALGFYPVNPAEGVYVFGRPMVEEAQMRIGDKEFRVIAHQLSDENIHVQSIRLNGQAYDKYSITHKDIVDGGTLEFFMGK
ncbi:MAG: GH92 family glycosyl hydrolase [Tannerella sp.]|jgi:predicted alpha-1,2-mannosidase|nr:GH92 family glycosyl hydrolase [Tannerella sp.]